MYQMFVVLLRLWLFILLQIAEFTFLEQLSKIDEVWCVFLSYCDFLLLVDWLHKLILHLLFLKIFFHWHWLQFLNVFLSLYSASLLNLFHFLGCLHRTDFLRLRFLQRC